MNEEYTCPVTSSTDLMETLSGLIIKSTSKVVVTFICPPAAVLIDDPTVSFVFKSDKLKDPPSEVKIADATSGSLASWEKEKENSETESHSNVLKDMLTMGENGIQGNLPVFPPTQFPQLSIQAVPLGVLLQSTG